MERKIVQYVLNRCKISDIPKLVSEWGCLNLDQINFKQPKRDVLKEIIEGCGDNLTPVKAGDLQLIHAQQCSVRRKWSCFQLSDVDDSQQNVNPKKLLKVLKEKLPTYFSKHELHTYVSGRVDGEALWIWVYVRQSKNYMPSNTIMFVHYPRTPYIVISELKVKFQAPLIECLVYTFGYSKLINMKLTGIHMESLFKLAINSDSQGAFSKYRLNKVQNTPLSRRSPQKRKEPEPENNVNIFCENTRNKRRKLEILDNTFGTEEQPKLEKVEYQLEVRFRGTEHAPAMLNRAQPFRCKFKFEGPAVLEGIKNLGKTGLATVPLPSILTSVSSKARNRFVLRDSRLADQSSSKLSQQSQL